MTNLPTVKAVVGLGEARTELAALVDPSRYHDAVSLEAAINRECRIRGNVDL